MADILLTTLNAKYAHAAFGLRYLRANLGALRERSAIHEFDINQRPIDMLEAILAHSPVIVGIGIYIWNVAQTTLLVADLRRIRPDILIVLGGPEISYETDQQEITALADYVITGEADLAFADLCEQLWPGQRPPTKVIAAALPQFAPVATPIRTGVLIPISTPVSIDIAPRPETARSAQRHLALPYDLYDDRDIAHRVIYVEASRGCPFKCEFCLSSLDIPVRNAPLDAFLAAMASLLDRGVMHFKFVDRTFNLNLNVSRSILEFFFARHRPGLFLHFEMIPDRLPEPLRHLIAQFPAGALQFEVGVQTFNDDVAHLISRRQDNEKLADNLRFLRKRTGVHVHADLIAGLPGEDLASFADGFDRLIAMGPQEIQVGILKRLRGTPIIRHDKVWEMVYSPNPPYEVLATKQMDFATLQARAPVLAISDLLANSGNFIETLPSLWIDETSGEKGPSQPRSAFWSFLSLSDWLFARLGRNHGIALQDLAGLLFEYLTQNARRSPQKIAAALWRDYQRTGRSDRPAFLRPYVTDAQIPAKRAGFAKVPKRQARHLADAPAPGPS